MYKVQLERKTERARKGDSVMAAERVQNTNMFTSTSRSEKLNKHWIAYRNQQRQHENDFNK